MNTHIITPTAVVGKLRPAGQIRPAKSFQHCNQYREIRREAWRGGFSLFIQCSGSPPDMG